MKLFLFKNSPKTNQLQLHHLRKIGFPQLVSLCFESSKYLLTRSNLQRISTSIRSTRGFVIEGSPRKQSLYRPICFLKNVYIYTIYIYIKPIFKLHKSYCRIYTKPESACPFRSSIKPSPPAVHRANVLDGAKIAV